MATWAYEARDHAGKAIRGTREAPDRQTALDTLRSEGLFLTRLEATSVRAPRQQPPPRAERPAGPPPTPGGGHTVAPRPPLGSPSPYSTPDPFNGLPRGQGQTAAPPTPTRALIRANSKNLALFFRQLGAMMHAGTGLGQALNVMGQNAPTPALQQVAREMSVRVQSGEPLSTCMTSYPGLFTPLHVGMMTAGERGGFLERMFAKLAEYSERDYHLQQTIKRETMYPKMVGVCAIFIPALPALFLGGPGAYLSSVAVPLFVIGGLLAAYRFIKYTSPLMLQQSGVAGIWDGLKLMIPGVSKVTRALATAKFARAMGALYDAGVGPSESVRLAASACGNETIARSVRNVIPRLDHGTSMTEALVSTRHFPPIVEQMLRIGEESGMLDEQLEKAADFLETDAETAIKQSTVMLGVAALLLVGGIVGYRVISFYTGYFNDIFKMADGV